MLYSIKGLATRAILPSFFIQESRASHKEYVKTRYVRNLKLGKASNVAVPLCMYLKIIYIIDNWKMKLYEITFIQSISSLELLFCGDVSIWSTSLNAWWMRLSGSMKYMTKKTSLNGLSFYTKNIQFLYIPMQKYFS